MTADQFTEKMIELRNKWKSKIVEAKERKARAAALVEELTSLGVRQDAYNHREVDIPNYEQAVQREMYEEILPLIRKFIGFSDAT
jgi:hypothetical protein